MILHSYSQEYPWTRGQHTGFIAALNADQTRTYDFKVEYLDTKRTGYGPDYTRFMASSLQRKYAGYRPDAIYVSDDNALSFAMAHMGTIFPGVPVFFSGVNDYSVKGRLDPSRFTGVFEKKEIGPNLALMKEIAKGSRDIVVVGDASETYRAIEMELRNELAKHPTIQASYISSNHLDDLTGRLKGLKTPFIFLTTLGSILDAEGRNLTLPEVLKAIVRAGNFVVFSMEDAYLQPGVLGGWVTSGPRQGEAAAGLLLKHLDGAPLSSLTPIEDSPNEYIFDDELLLQAGIVLPKAIDIQAIHRNKRPGFYETNRSLVLGSLYTLVALALLGLSVALIINRRRNRELQETSERITKSEARVRDAEQRMRLAAETAEVGFWEWDVRTGTIHWDAQMFRIYGLPPTTDGMIQYQNWSGAVFPEDLPEQEKILQETIRQQAHSQREFRILRHSDSKVRNIQAIETVLLDSDGKVAWVVGTNLDITERKEVEEDLRIAAVTFQSQEAVLITDADANIIRVNHAFEEITGYRAEDVIGRNPRIMKSGRHDTAFYEAMWASLRETGQWSGEIWDRRKNDEIYPKFMTITAVRNEHGVLTNYVCAFTDISPRKQTEEEIYQLAFFDPLTRLPNRRLFLDRLQQAIAASLRSNRHGALLMLDLDHFKIINDTQGHARGDQLLIEVGHRLKAAVREGDTVARLGGDEFVIILQELDEEVEAAASQADQVAENIRAVLAQPYRLTEYEYLSTSSMGITLFLGHAETESDLLKQADLALYAAKAAGRNAIRFYDPQMQATLDKRTALEADMHQALVKQEFLLHYQVQVDNKARPVGAEVLLRWQHPKRGFLYPDKFIPVAEDSGLIVPIGLWVLETACMQLVAWEGNPLTRDLSLAVNVSARQFRHTNFVAQVQRVLQACGANPARLKLELTESILLDNVEDAIGKMRALQDIGVSFSLDDFGTGHSSLSYLKRLPLDQVKIDRAFVRDIATDPNDAAIVKTIIAMSQVLGLNVVAEGVETEAQRDFLDRHGCHAFQGYLFGKPVAIDQFEAVLRDLSS